MAANIDVFSSLEISNTSGNPFIISGQVNNGTTTFDGGVFQLFAPNNTHMRIEPTAIVEVNDQRAVQGHPLVYGTLQFNPGLGNISLVGLSATGTTDINDNTLFLHDGNITGPIINSSGNGNLTKFVYHVLTLGGIKALLTKDILPN